MSDKRGSRRRGDHCLVRIHPATFVTRTNAGNTLSQVNNERKAANGTAPRGSLFGQRTGDLKAMTKPAQNGRKGGQPAIHAPPVVSPEAWESARQQMLVKEKSQTHARDALAAERRRMPWMAVEKPYSFDGPAGKV